MDFIVIPLLATLGYLAYQGTPQDHVTLLPDRHGTVGAVLIKSSRGEQLLNTAYASAEVSSTGRLSVGHNDAQTIRERYAATLAALPPPPESFTVYFMFGSDTELAAESVPVLEQVKSALASRPAAEVRLIGHTDRVGKLEDNDALSLRRASTVRGILANAGVQAQAMELAGRGEREPLVPTADEVAEEKNRRVEISLR
jgi:OmpA-OmpF porin, OOP family